MDRSSVDDPIRRLALGGMQIVDTPPEPQFNSLVFRAAALCEAPVAWLSFLDDDREWFKAVRGAGMHHLPRAFGFGNLVLARRDVVVIEDLSRDPRLRGHHLVLDGPRWRFYAAAPLTVGLRQVVGTIAVVDVKPRRLTAEQETGLRNLASEAVAALRRRRRLIGPSRASVTSVAEVDLLSTRDVGQLVKASPRAVTTWAAQGRLDAVRTNGGRYRFTQDAVVDFLIEPTRHRRLGARPAEGERLS